MHRRRIHHLHERHAGPHLVAFLHFAHRALFPDCVEHHHAVDRRSDAHQVRIGLCVHHRLLRTIALNFQDLDRRLRCLPLQVKRLAQLIVGRFRLIQRFLILLRIDARYDFGFLNLELRFLQTVFRSLQLGLILGSRGIFLGLLLGDLIYQLLIFRLFVDVVAHLRLPVELYERISPFFTCVPALRCRNRQVSTLTIVHLTAAGTHVKKGDPLVEFDRQAQMRDYIDKQAEYQKLVDQVAEEQAKENAARAKDETELKTAEDSLQKAQLEIQKAEIVSRIDAEKNQETLDEAKATYDQLRETFDLKRKAAQAAIKILEIQRDRTQQTMMHAQANSDLMRIGSPIDGVVVLNTIWKQGTMGEVQEGDQVRPGVPFMQVVNPAAMQVRVLANQQDFPALQVGQTAKVRLDAYPELVFSAKLEQMAPIGQEGDFSNKVRTFVVILSLQGNNPKLMPDLSAAVDVDVSLSKKSTSSASTSGPPERESSGANASGNRAGGGS